MKVDMLGNELFVGDKVVVGADNGSRLYVVVVTKLTACYVFFSPAHGASRGWNGRRAYERIVKYMEPTNAKS